MKENITKFDLDAAFKALDEINYPEVSGGILGNRLSKTELKESQRKPYANTDCLFEDLFNINSKDGLDDAQNAREAEVAKAKLARIEKIVDLDAESEEDLEPSYVGKAVIQCPQCLTLFYKKLEDVVPSEDNETIVNVGETCQHCGNDSGYNIIGKVAEVNADELAEFEAEDKVEDEAEDTDTEELALDLEDIENEESAEEPAEEEAKEESESDESNLEEINIEEKEEVEESLNVSQLLKDGKNLDTENHSENLTLNEADIKLDISDAEWQELLNSDEFKTPISKVSASQFLTDSLDTAAEVSEEDKILLDDDIPLEEIQREEVLEECITQSLSELYDNIEGFKLTESQLANGKLDIKGNIIFKSGKIKPTTYTFNKAHFTDRKYNEVLFEGINSNLNKDGTFKLNGILEANKTIFIPTSFSYQYKINNILVEGLALGKK